MTYLCIYLSGDSGECQQPLMKHQSTLKEKPSAVQVPVKTLVRQRCGDLRNQACSESLERELGGQEIS